MKIDKSSASHSRLTAIRPFHRLSSALKNFEQVQRRVSDVCRGTLVNSMGFHLSLTARMRVEQNSHPNLVTQLSHYSHSRLIARMRVEQNSHPNLVTQLSHNSHSRLIARMKVEQNFHPNLVTQLSDNSCACFTWALGMVQNKSSHNYFGAWY